jgi:hypothetical protein
MQTKFIQAKDNAMKKGIILLTILASVNLLSTAHAVNTGITYENDAELQATGDFDGNGLTDMIIADKASGAYRIAYQTAPDTYEWTDSRASGMENLTGLSVGYLLATNSDALAFASIEANRVFVIDATNRSAAGSTTEINYDMLGAGLGPQSVLAIDIPTTGNTPHDDLQIISTQNDTDSGFSKSNVMGTVRSQGTNFMDKTGTGVNEPLTRANRFYPVPGATNMSAYIAPAGEWTRLRVASGKTTGNAADYSSYHFGTADYTFGTFGTDTVCSFIVYLPGKADLYLYALSEGDPGEYEMDVSADAHFSLANYIDQIITVSASGTNALLVLRADGSIAELYAYAGGTNRPVLIQDTFTLPSGTTRFTGALPLSDTDFMLLSGNSDGITLKQERFSHNGSTFVSAGTDDLSGIDTYSGKANVMVYEEEPFVASFPKRRAAWHQGDWVTNVTAGASVEADYLTDQGLTNGLQSAGSAVVGTTPSGASYPLGNQPHEAISVFSFDQAYGEQITDISIDPPPGYYTTSIQVTLTNQPAADLYYRAGSGAWELYTNSFWVYQDTIVAYYAESGSTRSPLYFAPYTLSAEPGEMDSDNDGVPDYVEIANGLDPVTSGTDADGDGLSDLEELVQGTLPGNPDSDGDTYTDMQELRAGTDPNNASDTPDLPITNNCLSLVQQNAAYDLAVTPRPHSLSSNYTNNYVYTGTQARAYTSQGSLLAYGTATNLTTVVPGFTNPVPSILLQNLSARQALGMITAATEANFAMSSGGTNYIQGRELLALYPTPDIGSVNVSNTYSGGSLSSEASAWTDAARALYTNATAAPIDQQQLDMYTTLAALIFERAVGDILYARSALTNDYITLFPFRTGDASLTTPTLDDLLAIENPPTNTGWTAYRLVPMLTNIAAQIASTGYAKINSLKYVTAYIYSTSSHYSQDNPGVYRQPVNVLRDFLYSGTIDSAYTSTVFMSQSIIDAAYEGSESILESLSTRPTASYTVEYRTNSLSDGAVTLWTTGTPVTAKCLYSAPGTPYTMPQTFNLLPDSILSVYGYTDLEEDCTGDPIQVLSIALLSIPAPVEEDSTGNQLPDAWELEVFGSVGNDARADDDSDGYSNLHEYLGASNAANSNSTPEDIEISYAKQADGILRLDWPWWEDYITNFVFTAQATADLFSGNFATFETAPEGSLQIDIDPSTIHTNALFFRITIEPR